jgi:hypothetical protein
VNGEIWGEISRDASVPKCDWLDINIFWIVFVGLNPVGRDLGVVFKMSQSLATGWNQPHT